jgi:hypothetical protein
LPEKGRGGEAEPDRHPMTRPSGPPTTISIASKAVGDPRLPVRHVAASWGNASQIPTIHLLNGAVDVAICGYTHEWEAVEYAQDMVATGAKKGLILLGEAKSIDGGMKYCAHWLKTFITEVPIDYLPIAAPFWSPDESGG